MLRKPRGRATRNNKCPKKQPQKSTSEILREVRKRSESREYLGHEAKYKKGKVGYWNVKSEKESRKLNFIGTVLKDIEQLEKQDELRRTQRAKKSRMCGVVAANSLLHQKALDIKQQGVSWAAYKQSQMITQDDLQFLTSYEQAANADERTALLASDQVRQQCAKTLCSLVANISKDQTVQYLLILVDDMLEESPDRVELFRDYTRKHKESVYAPFLNLLCRQDGFIANMAARIIAKIACNGRARMEDPDLTKYLIWLRDQLRLPNNEYVQSAARCLQMMLRIDDYRRPFDAIDGINAIVEVLRVGQLNFQMQYQCTFCLWVLAFNGPLCARMSQMNIVPVLSDLLTQSQKEKVTRIVLATLRQNFLEKPEEPSIVRENSINMIQCKVLKNLVNLQQNPREDPDVVDDINYLVEKLQIIEQDMSSFDEYVNEVKMGRLEWSPVHSSEKFWRENAEKLNEKNYELLKMLISLLESEDPLIVTVAAHDLGEYVRHYPRGKQVIEKLNGKHLVMQLLSHSDPNVRYEALLCVQKLMVHNWEYLGRQMQSEQQNLKKGGPRGQLSPHMIRAN
ncbi:V-type proton ATPase subunit H-like [Tropilaelaps mercedesae]|uniref:V-type proton ATPase subunit H-like n=1 Tax=Tropilaelaps mercedesae TaxID=418985 RepID=A0A1V9XFT1_9ACAR|nr:V-type proton ATPase subunit H-like [Tropilaelaps mercedesae]